MSHVVVGTTVGGLKDVEGRVPLLRQELQVAAHSCQAASMGCHIACSAGLCCGSAVYGHLLSTALLGPMTSTYIAKARAASRTA